MSSSGIGAARRRLATSTLLRAVASGVGFIAAAVIGGSLATGASTAESRLQRGFVDEFIARVPSPTALAFTPDGGILVTTKDGLLYLIVGTSGTPRAAIDLRERICTERERGLTGVAIDPAFDNNRYVYLYYTFKKHGSCPIQRPNAPVNRVVRYVLGNNGTLQRRNERILLDNIPSPGGTHNGGDLQFGNDGYLYVSIGDGGRDYAGRTDSSELNAASRDRNVVLGKVLRITRSGGVPRTNPFVGTTSRRCALTGVAPRGAICRETYTWGHRNPFRLAFDRDAPGVRLFVNDVGQSAWEEINEARPGGDYGWNSREGFCPRGRVVRCAPPAPSMTNPIYAYGHRDGCTSITGGAFIPQGTWPERLKGRYLFADFLCGKIFTLQQAGGVWRRTTFASGLGPASIVSMAFGPASSGQALYYTTFARGGELRRIRYAGARRQ